MISPFSAPYFSVRPANFKSLFWSPKYLFKKNSNRLKEKYTDKENEQNLESDIPKFRVGFFEFLSRTSKKTLGNIVTYRTFYLTALQKTLAYLNFCFRVILHYSKLWVLNEYFELLTSQSLVFIGSQWNVLVLRIWCAVIIDGRSAWIEIFFPPIWIKRYYKYLTNLVFLGPYNKLWSLVFPAHFALVP